jgi:hypothetical protein
MLSVRHLQLRFYALTDPVEGEFNFYIVVWDVRAKKRSHETGQLFKTEERARVCFETYAIFSVN